MKAERRGSKGSLSKLQVFTLENRDFKVPLLLLLALGLQSHVGGELGVGVDGVLR